MNKLRRRQLRAALDLLDEARSILETVQEDEQEAFDMTEVSGHPS